MPNGNYKLIAKASGLEDPFFTPLDGDGNGVAGNDFVYPFEFNGFVDADPQPAPLTQTLLSASKAAMTVAMRVDLDSDFAFDLGFDRATGEYEPYSWTLVVDWGDGSDAYENYYAPTITTSSIPTYAILPTHEYEVPGTYTVEITVTGLDWVPAGVTEVEIVIDALGHVATVAHASGDKDVLIWGSENNDEILLSMDNDDLVIDAEDIETSTVLAAVPLSGVTGSIAIFGYAGNDYIAPWELQFPIEAHGGLGDDTIFGSDGNDTLGGYFDGDSILGELGNDFLLGADGHDILEDFGAVSVSELDGATNYLDAGTGDDLIIMWSGNNVAIGRVGNDEFRAKTGRSVAVGGTGADRFYEEGLGEHIVITGDLSIGSEEGGEVSAEWFSGHGFSERIANLSNSGSTYSGDGFLIAGETVRDDGEADIVVNTKVNFGELIISRSWYFIGFRDDEYHSNGAPRSDEVFTNISPVIISATYSSSPTEHVTFTLDTGAAVRYDDNDDIIRSLATDMGYAIYSYVIDWGDTNETLPGGSSGGDIADFESDINEIFLATIEVKGHTTDARAMTTLFVVGTPDEDEITVAWNWETVGVTYVLREDKDPWNTTELLDSVVVVGLAGNDTIAFTETVVEFTTVVDTGEGDDFVVVLDGALNEYHVSGGAGDDAIWLVEGYYTRITMLGGAGVDELLLFEGELTTAVVNGGDDDDIIVNLATGTTVLVASGGNGRDTLVGGAGDDWLDGGAGDDLLIGGVLEGDGDDTLMGGDDDDVLVGSDGADYLDAGSGEDLVITGWLSEEMYGEELEPGILQVYYEWLQSGDIEDRMERLQGFQTPLVINAAFYLVVGETVLNDDCIDIIMAGEGDDGVFYDFGIDRFLDYDEEEDERVNIGE